MHASDRRCGRKKRPDEEQRNCRQTPGAARQTQRNDQLICRVAYIAACGGF
jgi:hypothetical protein